MSEPPEKQHPWSDYYAERGLPRPPAAAMSRKNPPSGTPAPGQPSTPAPGAPPISSELAAAVDAATAGMAGSTAAPFITILQREAAARERRRQLRVRWARRAVIGLAGLVVLHFAITRIFYRSPSAAALDAYADSLTHAVVALHSTAQQPLLPAGTVVTLSDRVTAGRIRYAAEVTLRLAQPLYIPATSNGTTAYRQMQQSLHAAREKELKFKLFEGKDGPGAPAMPLLIQVAHRAGERLSVRVPFEVKRFGWHWRIEPAVLALRAANRSFDGATIERYRRVPHLVFGAPGTLADMRRRALLARAYIVAVTKEIQKRADFEAIEATTIPALADLPAIDPDAPAAADGIADQPALDPNAPALDPNAPAVDDKPPSQPAPPRG